MMNRPKRLVAFLFGFFVLFSLLVGCSNVQAAEAPNTIVIQSEQWTSLKKKTNLLEAKLSIASDILSTQKLTSTELLTQLSEAKKQLSAAQEALTSSKRSLVSAKESLKRSNELYEKLTKQIEQEKKRTGRIRTQRNVYAACAVFAIVVTCVK